MSDMEKITHMHKKIGKEWNMATLCGQETNCTANTPVPVHHCSTIKIEKVSCADCADIYAEQQRIKQDAKLTLNEIYGKGKENIVRQSDLDTAFKLIAAKDKEIAQLENDNKLLTRELSKSSNQVLGLNVKTTRLENENKNLKGENIRLELDIEHLKFETTTLRHAFRSAINEPTAFKIVKL